MSLPLRRRRWVLLRHVVPDNDPSEPSRNSTLVRPPHESPIPSSGRQPDIGTDTGRRDLLVPVSSHWDLMLEKEPATVPPSPQSASTEMPLSWTHRLETWALRDNPLAVPTTTGRKLDDHRTVYLEFEGPLSGNRGHVTRIAAGEISRSTGLADGTREFWLVRLDPAPTTAPTEAGIPAAQPETRLRIAPDLNGGVRITVS